MAKRARGGVAGVGVEASLTPLIDITFLLLIFFVVTSRFRPTEGRLEALLPRDRGVGAQPVAVLDDARVRLRWLAPDADTPTSDAHGRCAASVGARRLPNTRYAGDGCAAPGCGADHGSPDFAALGALVAELAAAHARHEGAAPGAPRFEVTIDAEARVPFRFVVRALNACLEAGVREVRFAAPSRAVD